MLAPFGKLDSNDHKHTHILLKDSIRKFVGYLETHRPRILANIYKAHSRVVKNFNRNENIV